MRYTRIILLIIAPLLLASTAMSQTDWEAVQALPNGTKIKVTLKNRPTFGHCFLDGVSDDQLVCSTGRWPLSRRNVYIRDDIKAVYLVHNGPAIGLAVGAGAGAVIGVSRDPVPGLGRGGTALLSAGLMGGLGAFVGMVADPFFHGKAVYRSPNALKDANRPPTEKEQSTSKAADNLPCLKDGKTLQCVDHNVSQRQN
jgi:hypothetical protein